MEIWHRVSINSKKDAKFFAKVKELKIDYQSLELPGGESSLITFDMKESNSRWNTIEELIILHQATDIVDTFFSEEEIRSAAWLRLVPTFIQGYPEPKSQWPIKQQTHKILCAECATRDQINSFRISKEPNLHENSFMSFNWCGEIFATQKVFDEFASIAVKGYEIWDVLLNKTGLPSVRIKQLYIPKIAEPGLTPANGKDLELVVCKKCGTRKYYPHVKGTMRLKFKTVVSGTDFILTDEWFGSGLIAYREILVSNRIAQLFLDRRWRGARLKVVELV